VTRPFSPISYREGLERSYDAVVVGSGIGGLICANLLASSQLSVLLVEQHSMCGGFCSGFIRHARPPLGGTGCFVYDSASHFFPLLGNPASISGRLLRDLQVQTQWVKMDPVDQFHFPDGSHFAVPADIGTYLAQLKRMFPLETVALDEFFALARKLYLWGVLYYFQGCEVASLRRYLPMTVRDALNQYFKSEKLKLLLTADCPHWGSLPCRTSFVFDSMLRLSYFEGNYYPRGGAQAFADELARRFVALGGQILMKSLARRIVVRHGRAAAIEIETGPRTSRQCRQIDAGCIISNADMRQTVFGMVGERHFPSDFVSHVCRLRPSFPCFLSHIGVAGVPAEVLDQIQGYHWNNWDSDRIGEDAFQFKLFVPTLHDPQLAPPGGHVVVVQKVTNVDYESMTDWRQHKQGIEHFVLARLNDLVPGFSDKIVVCESASAQTSYRFTLNYHGAMLGWEMSPDQLGPMRPGVESPVDGLYFVGQWTRPGGGITPVIISAMNVASRVTGKRFPIRRSAGWSGIKRSPCVEIRHDEINPSNASVRHAEEVRV
jgi:prolycopene isomerase